MILWLDRETFSLLDLKVVGTYLYAEAAEDLLVAYAIDDGPEQVWDVTADPFCPDDLYHALQHADEVWAHNAQFDAAIHDGPSQRALPRVELHRWRCSMALALSHALPAGLGDLCAVLKVPEDQAKHKEGKKLINLFTKPLPKNRKLRRATRLTHPAEWERFKRYAANDIAAMRECVRRMPRWNWDDACVREWHLDQVINRRGFYVDRELTQAGIRAAESEIARLRERFREITQGVVDRPSQREQFMNYMNERFDLGLVDTTKDTFTQLIKEGGLDPEAQELMELCMAANRTSTAKYAALHPAVQADGRFRGGLQFAGAGRTRRWAGRKFQGQNLPARGLPPAEMVESYIEHLKNGTHDLMFDDLMRYGAAALRGVVIAPPFKKLAVADLSNIEGRKLSWFAQEHWKLKAFRDYDAGTGPDLYKITAASILGGSPYDVSKKNRDVFGKVPDLASGYQGGVAGYQNFAHAYGVRMADHWGTIQASIEPHIVEKAWENLEKWGRPQLETLEIDEIEWVASETCKLKWRSRHPATVEFWYALQKAAREAIRNPGMTYSVGPFLKVKCVGFLDQRWLVVKLPSGRFLTYFEPHLIDDTICYWGEASEEGKSSRAWVRCFTHGGKMTGNVCQTSARDVIAQAMQRAEDSGYLPVLSVHDEVIAEVDDTPEFNAQGLIDILAYQEPWTEGLPLAAAGFTTMRYHKD